MLFLKLLLYLVGFGFLAAAAGVILYDIYLAFELDRILRRKPRLQQAAAGESLAAPAAPAVPEPTVRPRRAVRWTAASRLSAIAAAAALGAGSIVVVPDGHAAVRISQLWGVERGTLYSGTHFILPLITRVELYDVRDRLFSTASNESSKPKAEPLTVEAREGLSVGVAVTVRYRLDPTRLDYIQANLPRALDDEIVEPVITSAFRQLGPDYVVRDIFSIKREEFRSRAAQLITLKLGQDGIVVKEVLLRRIMLPEEYARGLEGLLLKEQEDDRMGVETNIEQKRVKIAEAQAEAAKIREVKRAEAGAAAEVLQAKAQSDSMQYTLPLKQKQIEQSRLEAEARKETTIKNAEAEAAARVKNAEAEAAAKVIESKAEQERVRLVGEAQNAQMVKNAEATAQAKVIDGNAELKRRNLLADAEAYNTRVTAQAEAEELRFEAEALKTNPLLVQYTVAQRLSDRVQIMMVPTDGKFFFTNDVLKSISAATDNPLKASAR
jgi:regulator of protease activity HflC (stomatin/prohibitin superfamily)